MSAAANVAVNRQPLLADASGLPTNGSTPWSLLQIRELSQDQMTEAESVPTRKAAHCNKAEIQSHDRHYRVENARHD
jgi:hypothetical protein